jgi:hypothetical protein
MYIWKMISRILLFLGQKGRGYLVSDLRPTIVPTIIWITKCRNFSQRPVSERICVLNMCTKAENIYLYVYKHTFQPGSSLNDKWQLLFIICTCSYSTLDVGVSKCVWQMNRFLNIAHCNNLTLRIHHTFFFFSLVFVCVQTLGFFLFDCCT